MKSAERIATDKARAWFGRDDLVTAAEIMDWDPPEAMVQIGTIAAIEYESDKFDGEMRLYRHDVTMQRRMMISPDGSTIVVDPPFRITKRGIEG